MLMGLVTKNAILLVDFINHGMAAGKSRRDAVIAAGGVRLRPIMMTTLAMIFGMIRWPWRWAMAPSSAHRWAGGDRWRHDIQLLTLIVVPVIYTYLDDFTLWLRRRFAGPSGDRRMKLAPIFLLTLLLAACSEPPLPAAAPRLVRTLIVGAGGTATEGTDKKLQRRCSRPHRDDTGLSHRRQDRRA